MSSDQRKQVVYRPGKTREDRMPVEQRPRVKAAQARYRKLRQSQGLDKPETGE